MTKDVQVAHRRYYNDEDNDHDPRFRTNQLESGSLNSSSLILRFPLEEFFDWYLEHFDQGICRTQSPKMVEVGDHSTRQNWAAELYASKERLRV